MSNGEQLSDEVVSAASEKLMDLYYLYIERTGPKVTEPIVDAEWEDAAKEFPPSVKARMMAFRDAIRTADSLDVEHAPMYQDEERMTFTRDLRRLNFRKCDFGVGTLLSQVLLSRGAENPTHIADRFDFANEAENMASELGLSNGWDGSDVVRISMDSVGQAIVRGRLPVTRPASMK